MAQKKATVYILNVSNEMSHYPDNAFEKALNCIISSLENKVLSGRKTDLVSVVLAGTQETKNDVAEEAPGQYQNILVAYPLQQPNLELLREMKKVCCNHDPQTKADILDAVIVAVQSIAQHCKKLKYEKCIAVFTDAKDPIDWQDFDAVFDTLRENNITLLFIGVDYQKNSLLENYTYWKAMAEKSFEGYVCGIDEMVADIQRPRIKEVRPTPSFRGFLYIGDPGNKHHLAISINMFLRVKEVKFPIQRHKCSRLSQGPTFNVTTKTTYTVLTPNDPDQFELKVERDDLEKAYRFGKEMVPRYYLKSHPYVVAAGTFRTNQSGEAIASYAQALDEKNMAAIVKYVYKDGDLPKLGVLLPCSEGEIQVLQFIEVPFAEDIGSFEIQKHIPKDLKTNDQKGQELIKELIDTMDLKIPSREKYLDPQNTFNPVYWRTSQYIKDRALDPVCPVPKMPKEFDAGFRVHSSLTEPLARVSKKLSEHYNVKKVKEKKTQEEEEVRQLAPMDDIAFEDKIAKIQRSGNLNGVPDISVNTPIEDFKYMINYKESDLVSQAVERMNKVIMSLIISSFGNLNYRKVIECLEVMRVTAAEEDEAKVFNDTLYQLKEWCQLSNKTSARREFWIMLKASKITLIIAKDSADAAVKDLTEEDANKFFEDEVKDILISSKDDDNLADDDFNVDDLLDQMDL